MFDYRYLEPKDFDTEPLLPYRDMILFSMDFLKPYDPQKVWLRLSLENTEEGDTELGFNMINSIGHSCRCCSCPYPSDIDFTIILNKIKEEEIPHIIQTYKNLVQKYFIPKKGMSYEEETFESFRYEVLCDP